MIPQGYKEAVCYLQIENKSPGPYGNSSDYSSRAKVVRMTQDKPNTMAPNCVLVKVRIQVPKAAFKPLEPEAVVRVPEELVQHVVNVEATDMEAAR